MSFKELGLEESILMAIEKQGYKKASPIQEKAIPYILQGRDILGCAQTGTGKTAAFALPLINKLYENQEHNKGIKILVLTPTRELAVQVRDSFRHFTNDTNLKCSVILGGVNQNSQLRVLKKGVEIIVATPGRLLDLIKQGHVKLNTVKYLVLDEADTMLDMGFIHDVKQIISYIPKERQTLLFSATMPNSVIHLANEILNNHITIKLNVDSMTVEKINQSLYLIDKKNKTNLLLDILNNNDIKSVLIFVKTKRNASKLGDSLKKYGINNGVIHGDKPQSSRISALNNFKNGKYRVLVATDIAARGIDISGLTHVINYEIPEMAETYVHRIGRTGRAGFSGTAISFCDIEENKKLKSIEKLINFQIPVIVNHGYPVNPILLSPDKNDKSTKFNKKRTRANKKRFNNAGKNNHRKQKELLNV